LANVLKISSKATTSDVKTVPSAKPGSQGKMGPSFPSYENNDAELLKAIRLSEESAERERRFHEDFEIALNLSTAEFKGGSEKSAHGSQVSENAPTMRSEASVTVSEIFEEAIDKAITCWEPQVCVQCGLHAMNCVLCMMGKAKFKYEDFQTLLMSKIPIKERTKEKYADIYENGIGFTDDAISVGLNERRVTFDVFLRSPWDAQNSFEEQVNGIDGTATAAIIVHAQTHWYALAQTAGMWFNMNSLNKEHHTRVSIGGKEVTKRAHVKYFMGGLDGVKNLIGRKEVRGIYVVKTIYESIKETLSPGQGECNDNDGNTSGYEATARIVKKHWIPGGDTLISFCTGGARAEAFIVSSCDKIKRLICFDALELDDRSGIASKLTAAFGIEVQYHPIIGDGMQAVINAIEERRYSVGMVVAINEQQGLGPVRYGSLDTLVQQFANILAYAQQLCDMGVYLHAREVKALTFCGKPVPSDADVKLFSAWVLQQLDSIRKMERERRPQFGGAVDLWNTALSDLKEVEADYRQKVGLRDTE
jgi:hypothetical protein